MMQRAGWNIEKITWLHYHCDWFQTFVIWKAMEIGLFGVNVKPAPPRATALLMGSGRQQCPDLSTLDLKGQVVRSQSVEMQLRDTARWAHEELDILVPIFAVVARQKLWIEGLNVL
ncbi:hypothetical protein A3K87_13855 [Variovorax paradoxus]|uniref:Uncharacterized protein n=1 Tax=Variovorax paradoxus TaxID=34073 RepID=A0AA91DP20_VARPD|nr:hypothetical protein A3K87_13855 [Variovorax paradoxus]